MRHPPVVKDWQKRCYGTSDMGLSREGARMAKSLVARLITFCPEIIIHSDRKRTRNIAERAAVQLSINAHSDPRWRERDFGSWEGRTWNQIYRETGDAMDGMMDNPHGFRPGGGETTAELLARAIQAWHHLPSDRKIVVVTHGGPIAAILSARKNAPLRSMSEHIPAPGAITEIERE
ncbi:histidine phosphatase family protein [Parasphingorhabdus marina]|uniref:histidine phosphatase family protein n=1 Tax=Parasphingorhabdus marina TaxID=394732 RepID=UPI001EF5EDF3|nr:histidine phosphatase family protein [Parasphingorhabdus marina]